MKKLLAEKKVEVTEREKKPPEVGTTSKRPSMVWMIKTMAGSCVSGVATRFFSCGL